MSDEASYDTSGSNFADITRFRRVDPNDAGLHYGDRAIQRCEAASHAAEEFLAHHETIQSRDTSSFLGTMQFVQQQLAAARCLRDLMSTAFALSGSAEGDVPPNAQAHQQMRDQVAEQIARLEDQHQRLLIQVALLPRTSM